MNEIKTLTEIADMVDAGHEIEVLTSVWQDGVRYLVVQDNTAKATYSVEIE